jgi:type III secretion system YscQ/HrcQ family protein
MIRMAVRRSEIPLWNWHAAAFPGVVDWTVWLADVAGQMVRQPGPTTVRVLKTNLVEPELPAERICFDGPALGIGRAPENGVVLTESTITRQHARLRRRGDSILLEDLGSAMGTIRNGSKLTPTVPVEVGHGDEFVVFPHRFQLEVQREWVVGGGVRVSEAHSDAATWEEFRKALPMGWRGVRVTVEPLCGSAALAAPRDFPSPSEAAIEDMLLAALDRANRDLAFPFQFSVGPLSLCPRIEDDARGIVSSAVLDLAGIRGAIRLFLPFELLRRMQERWTPRPPDALAEKASWRFPFSAGHVDLNAEERRSIDPGDVVLYCAEPALLFPGDDRLGYRADWDNGGHARLHDQFDRRLAMSDSDPVSFQDLPVRVQVLVDEHELTLAQAELLAPGAVLDLDRDPCDPVRLAVNGRVVGTGELVEVEGRLGVKILEWSKR